MCVEIIDKFDKVLQACMCVELVMQCFNDIWLACRKTYANDKWHSLTVCVFVFVLGQISMSGVVRTTEGKQPLQPRRRRQMIISLRHPGRSLQAYCFGFCLSHYLFVTCWWCQPPAPPRVRESYQAEKASNNPPSLPSALHRLGHSFLK